MNFYCTGHNGMGIAFGMLAWGLLSWNDLDKAIIMPSMIFV
jgi:hypothetical protein